MKEGERQPKNVFAQVKHSIMMKEENITFFSKTKFNPKYLPIESNITPKTN